MSAGLRTRSRGLSIPEIPRITGGLVLAAGAVGHVIGAGGISGEIAPELLIVAISSIGLIVSGAVDRSTRVTRVNRHSVDLLGSREFRREFHRARRRESPLTLVRLPAPRDTRRASSSARDALRAVRRSLRRVDVGWANRGDIYLVMPDTDTATARFVLDRLRHRAPAAFAGPEPLLATFPEDGLTPAALVARVTGRPSLGPSHAPVSVPVRAELDASILPARNPTRPGIASGRELEMIPPSAATDAVRDSGEPS